MTEEESSDGFEDSQIDEGNYEQVENAVEGQEQPLQEEEVEERPRYRAPPRVIRLPNVRFQKDENERVIRTPNVRFERNPIQRTINVPMRRPFNEMQSEQPQYSETPQEQRQYDPNRNAQANLHIIPQRPDTDPFSLGQAKDYGTEWNERTPDFSLAPRRDNRGNPSSNMSVGVDLFGDKGQKRRGFSLFGEQSKNVGRQIARPTGRKAGIKKVSVKRQSGMNMIFGNRKVGKKSNSKSKGWQL